MEWYSVEIPPKKSKIYFVMGFDKMFYWAKYSRRDKEWSSFKHFLGPINEETNERWFVSIKIRAWSDPNEKEISKAIIFPGIKQKLEECQNCGNKFEICFSHLCGECT